MIGLLADHGHWLATTLADNDFGGGTPPRSDDNAPCVPPHASWLAWGPRGSDGPTNDDCFRAWTEQMLASQQQVGAIVVLDNLSSHKVAGSKEAIESRGATLLNLPPCCPDMNPIEQVFANLQHFWREAGARTVETRHEKIGALIDRFSPEECQNHIQNSGHGST